MSFRAAKGTPRCRRSRAHIREGAMAFLNRQYRTIGMLAVVAAVLIGILLGAIAPNVGDHLGRRARAGGRRSRSWSARPARLSAGFIGMCISVQANLRDGSRGNAQPARRARRRLRGGAVSGFLVVALSLLGVLGHLRWPTAASRSRPSRRS